MSGSIRIRRTSSSSSLLSFLLLWMHFANNANDNFHVFAFAFAPVPLASINRNKYARATMIARVANANAKPGVSIFKPPLSSTSASATSLSTSIPGIELSNVLYDSASVAFDAWEWTANLGAPAALVAGAVLVTLSETRQEMSPRKQDPKWVRICKQTCRFLLLSSFALEVVSIFVGTVTGSVLLGHGAQVAASKVVGYSSPLGLLMHHHEFEYLTIQICFLQGLFNWLGAVVLEILIPKQGETTSAKRMNKCMASCLISLMLWITAFYNNHLNFYSDYACMLQRYFGLFVSRYLLCRPFRPMSLLYFPSFVTSGVLAWRAFKSPPEEDEDEDVDPDTDPDPDANDQGFASV